MTDIVDEAEMDRKEYMKVYYFKKALPYVLVATLIIVIGMVIYEYRKSNSIAHNMDMGDLIVDSIHNIKNDPNVAMEGLKYVEENAKSYEKDIASLQLAAINIAVKKNKDALASIENILNSKKYSELTMSYARLMWVGIKLDENKLSEEDQKLMEKYFASFVEKSPFYGSAKILEALFLKKNGKKEEAKKVAEVILASDFVPTGVKHEARAVLANLNN